MVRVVVYIGMGLVLLGINVWFILAVRSAFFDSARTKAIAPFRIIGREDQNGSLGIAMAHGLQARLSGLQRELATPVPDQTTIGLALRPLGVPFRQTDIPDRVFEPLDVTLNVAGVEVQGIFAKLQAALSASRVVEFVVEFQDAEAIVLGNLDVVGGVPIYMRTQPDVDAIVTAIAYAILQQEVAKKIDHVGQLEPAEFRTLIDSLNDLKRLNVEMVRESTTPESFGELLPTLRSLVAKMPNWTELLHLTAEVAHNANQPNDALEFYRRQLALLSSEDPQRAELETVVAEIEQTLPAASTEAVDQQPQPVAEPAVALKQLRESPWGQQLLDAFGITPTPLADVRTGPMIAVLGQPPSQGVVPDEQLQTLPGTQHDDSGLDYETQYVDELARLILMVAPSARLVFTPIDSSYPGGAGYTEQDIYTAIGRLLATAPDILVVTYGPLYGPRLQQILASAADMGTTVILATYALHPSYAQTQPFEVPNTLAVAGLQRDARDLGSLPARPDQQQMLLVPGDYLPALDRGSVVPRAGGPYAAAVVAGAVWHMKLGAPDASAREVIAALLDTSAQFDAGLRLMDLPSARAELRSDAGGWPVQLGQEATVQIPDNDPVGLQLHESTDHAGSIGRIRLSVDIRHTWIGDLIVALVAPDKTRVYLHNREGSSADNISRQYTDELTALIGGTIAGEWTLEVSDHSAQDVGRIERWKLEIQPRDDI